MLTQTGQIRPDRVALYIRWSTDDQADGTTLAVQREGCELYARSQGWSVRPELTFIDEGCSGGDLNRPALTRLRAAVAAGEVDCVLLFKLDRLSRNLVDTVNLVLREWEGRCHLKCARESIDTSNPAGKMLFYTLVSFAEWERAVIRERTLSGKLRRLQEGRNPGFRPPFGLRTGPTPGSFALVEHEAAIVRRVFALARAGYGPTRIARLLHAEGAHLRGGRPPTPQSVSAMLQNPIYCGRIAYGRRVPNPLRHAGGARQVKSRQPATVVEAPNLPRVVAPTLFDQVQRLRRGGSGRAPSRAASSPHLLTGLARCRCGSPLVGLRRPGASYYRCTGRRDHGPQFCPAAHIRQEPCDRWLLERLLAALPRAKSLDLPVRWHRLTQADQKQILRELVLDLQLFRAAGQETVTYRLIHAAGATPAAPARSS